MHAARGAPQFPSAGEIASAGVGGGGGGGRGGRGAGAQATVFLHLHKCGGTAFLDWAARLPGQRAPPRPGGNALLLCPPQRLRNAELRAQCGGDAEESLVPFWEW